MWKCIHSLTRPPLVARKLYKPSVKKKCEERVKKKCEERVKKECEEGVAKRSAKEGQEGFFSAYRREILLDQ